MNKGAYAFTEKALQDADVRRLRDRSLESAYPDEMVSISRLCRQRRRAADAGRQARCRRAGCGACEQTLDISSAAHYLYIFNEEDMAAGCFGPGLEQTTPTVCIVSGPYDAIARKSSHWHVGRDWRAQAAMYG